MTPLVSVIIPVYNVSPYLHQCIDSIVNQTLKDIEIICVDDGSTDDSLTILEEYAKRDDRITILQQKNKGGGAARNYGFSIATGDYVIWLDSDDFFNISLLEKCYSKAISTNSDITICMVVEYNQRLNLYDTLPSGALKWRYPQKDVFNYKDMPKYIFETFRLAPFNKFYNRKFIKKHQLKFQEIMRSNDVYHTILSLVFAERITVIPEILIYYRTGITQNCQSTTYKYPFGFFDAYVTAKKDLIKFGYWDIVKNSFINISLWGCISSLSSLKGFIEQKLVYNFLKTEGFDILGLSDISRTDIHNKAEYKQYILIKSTEYTDYYSNTGIKKRSIVLLPSKIQYVLYYGLNILRAYGPKYFIKTIFSAIKYYSHYYLSH